MSSLYAYEFRAANESDTERLGRALADSLPDTVTIALKGTLGAGKTRLVQALAAGCGLDPGDITSPTFVLCQPYAGRRLLYHLDAYRIRDVDEFLELGVEEYFEGPGVTLIEWADRVASCLPPLRLDVSIEITGEHSRLFTLIAHGREVREALAKIVALLQTLD